MPADTHPPVSSSFGHTTRRLTAALLLALAATQAPATPRLDIAASSDSMIWNAVAVDGKRVFVAGPRWTGSKGPSVGVLDAQGVPQPYPDAAWNGWQPGQDAARAFVNVNAIHHDRNGGLWVIDTGSPQFGGDPLPGGAKAVRIDLKTNRIDRVYAFASDIAQPGSYVDDIRLHGSHAYLTDAGRPGLIVLDLASGQARRVLDGAPSVTATPDRPIVLDGRIVRAPDGSPLRVNADPLEVSPDGRHLQFGPLNGPWSRIETRWLDDPSIDPAEVARHVEPWLDLPPVGGTAYDAQGGLYFTELATDSLKRRAPDGTIATVIQDKRLHWVDAPFVDAEGTVWLPTPQMDRVPLFNGGRSRIHGEVTLYRIEPDASAQPDKKATKRAEPN